MNGSDPVVLIGVDRRGACSDNGRPGLRPEYHPSYFGAFVLNPGGNNIEAVCHRPGKEA